MTKLLLTVAAPFVLYILTFAFGIGNIRHQLFSDLATQAHLEGKKKRKSEKRSELEVMMTD